MKQTIKKRIICLAVIAVALLAGSSVKSALAYFTTYVVVKDTTDLSVGFTETENAMSGDSAQKSITVENKGDYDCYVRVKVIVPSECGSVIGFNGEGWTEVNGYYEYSAKLEAKATTGVLTVDITEAADATENYNVIAVQECAPVLYDENGNTYASWDAAEFVIE